MLREEFMEPLGVSVEALAEAMGVSIQRIAGIVTERRGISADTARRLERYLGMPARFWTDLQSNYKTSTHFAEIQVAIPERGEQQ